MKGKGMAEEPAVRKERSGRKGCFSQILAVIGVLVSILYLLNLSMGIVEIPDNLPFIGNLDEVVVSTFLLACLRYLGIDLIPFGRKPEVSKRVERE